jgi:hypothetical protein
VWNLLSSGDDTNLIKSADLGTETSVDAEYLAVNDSGKSEEVKDLAARFPDRSVAVLLLALFVEAVNLRDLS